MNALGAGRVGTYKNITHILCHTGVRIVSIETWGWSGRGLLKINVEDLFSFKKGFHEKKVVGGKPNYVSDKN